MGNIVFKNGSGGCPEGVSGAWPHLNVRPQVEAAIRDTGADGLMFSDFGSNPLYESVCEGVELFRSAGCDAIMAVGGGSSIDVAKCIKLYSGRDVRLIALPTTAGTGSESTRYAVVYSKGEKQSVTDPGIIPDFAVLEPSVLESLPIYQKKCTMMDALCQGIESWWSVNSTEESRRLSRRVVELVIANWHAYIFDGGDPAPIMEAANLSGQAINITQTTAPHAFSYKLTSLFGLPHGHAVALCLPEIWEFMLEHPEQCTDPRGPQFLQSVFEDIADTMTAHSSGMQGSGLCWEAVAAFRAMLSALGLSSFGPADPSLIPTLAASVNPVRLANNPVLITTPAARSIYSRIL